MAKALVITEKPSVAHDIAEALGGFQERDGYWESADRLLTFAVGHLFELLSPEEVDEKYKRWTLDVLPILPERFELKKKEGQSERIRTIRKLIERDDVTRLVNACDAGREGELIFGRVLRYLGVEKPVERLWLQSMTRDAIRSGFASLRPASELEGLAAAAECRANSDWLIGMNATRVLTKRLKSRSEKGAWSAGRVQTPTLALLVARELEVLAHTPETFWRVTARFEHESHRYEGVWFDPSFKENGDDQHRADRLFDAKKAQAVVAAVRARSGTASETRKPSRERAPALFDLTSLQRESNSRFGWSARRALGAAQRCYERHKILTYPRTDSKALPEDYKSTVAEVLQKFASSRREDLADYAAAATRLKRDGLQNQKRIFNDALVSDHFAIIPTGVLPPRALSGDEGRLFDLVLRRFLGSFHPEALWERVERTSVVEGEHFRTSTRALMEPGWRAVLPASDTPPPLPPLVSGDAQPKTPPAVAVRTTEVAAEEQQTRPPARISEARLLSLMEHAGRAVDDEELAAVLSAKGLGTPATRADIIENLIAKSYVLRTGKALRPTVKGIRLIDTLKRIHVDRLASAELTGEIEQHLRDVEQGARSADSFMEEMREYASDIVERTRNFDYDEVYKDEPPLGDCPRCGRPVIEMTWFYRCKPQAEGESEGGDDDCPLRFWKDNRGRYLDRDAVHALLSDGKTAVLDGFTARDGRTYRGTVEIDREEWKLKVTSEGWNDDGGYQLPEYETTPEPLGACPFAAKCEVIETPTHFVCRTWQAQELALAEHRKVKAQCLERGEKAPSKPAPPAHTGFVLPRTVCKRELTRDEALHYLQHGRTELLEDFTSRLGRPFSAILVQQPTGRHSFEFPPRGKGAGAAGVVVKSVATKRRAAAGRRKISRKKLGVKKVVRKKAGRKQAARKKTAAKKTARKRSTRRSTALSKRD